MSTVTELALALVVCIAFLGAALASFACLIVDRRSRGESIVSPRSRCVGCKRSLAFYEIIPVVSWLLLRGRCRTCSTSIPPMFFLVELSAACIAGGVCAAILFH
jgi:prepilin signal peptidase PulO-like enzyme (type II secretory pathway)